tara:strand:+ start:690 stop:1217 length:528 start_codon:yes stop_codon:yes gene_type:complete
MNTLFIKKLLKFFFTFSFIFFLNDTSLFAAEKNLAWEIKCNKDNKKDCALVTRIMQKDSDQMIATLMIQLGTITKNEKIEYVPVITALLPFGLDLQKNPLLQVDKKNIGNLIFKTCKIKEGCTAQIVTTDETINKLIKGKVLSVFAGIHNNNKLTTFDFSLKDFNKNYKKLNLVK